MKWFFAYRYLVSHKSRSVINVITALSIVSVAIPLAAMIILLSVFNGFESLILDMYNTSDADIEIIQRNDAPPAEILAIDDSNLQKIVDIEGIESASFIIEQEVVLRHNDAYMLINVRGVDQHFFDVVEYHDIENCELQSDDIDRIVIDNHTAYTLGIRTLFDTRLQIQTLGKSQIGSILPMRGLRSAELGIAAVKNAPAMEQHYALVPLRTMQQLFATERATTIAIRTSDEQLSAIRERLHEVAGDEVVIRSRDEKNALFYAIMRYEKWAIFFVALLVLLIASMSIIGSVIMLITEKRHEEIILLSMGCTHRFIRGIFVCEGLLIALIGGVIGSIIGIGTIAVQHYFGIIKLPKDSFIIENYPVELHFGDVVITYVVFTAVALAAAYIATHKMIKNRALCND